MVWERLTTGKVEEGEIMSKSKKQVDNLLLKKVKQMLTNKNNKAPVSEYMKKRLENQRRIQEEMKK